MTADWTQLPDLASRRLGGSVLAANDEFFAERENLIKPDKPEFRPNTFTNKGQEYDGWETRRRRTNQATTTGRSSASPSPARSTPWSWTPRTSRETIHRSAPSTPAT